MNSYLDTLLEKNIQPGHGIQPRPISLFEPFPDHGNPLPFAPVARGFSDEPKAYTEEGSYPFDTLPKIYRQASWNRISHEHEIGKQQPDVSKKDAEKPKGNLSPKRLASSDLPVSIAEKDISGNGDRPKPVQFPVRMEDSASQNVDSVGAVTIQTPEVRSRVSEQQGIHLQGNRDIPATQEWEVGDRYIVKPNLRIIREEPDTQHKHKEKRLQAVSNINAYSKSRELAVSLSEKQAEPSIHVTIGRVEVRATLATSTPRKTQRQTAINLDDYLRQRQGGK